MKKLRKLLLMAVFSVMMLIPADLAYAAVRIPAIQPGEPIQRVDTLAWQATLKRAVRTKYGRFKAGTFVTVIKGGSKCTIRLKGHNYTLRRIWQALSAAPTTTRRPRLRLPTRRRARVRQVI